MTVRCCVITGQTITSHLPLRCVSYHLIESNVTLFSLLSVLWLVRLCSPRNILPVAIRPLPGGAGQEILGRPLMGLTNLLIEAEDMDGEGEEDEVLENRALTLGHTLLTRPHPFKNRTRPLGLPRSRRPRLHQIQPRQKEHLHLP